MVEKTRIVLVDDHGVVRQGVSLFLSQQPDLEIVGEAGDIVNAYRVISEADPDVILMDVSLGNDNSFELTRRIKTSHPDVRVLVVSANSDDAVVAQMLNAGADGYLLKDMALEELVRAVRSVALGQFVLHPSVAVRWRTRGREPMPRGDDDLTQRESEIIRHMADGATSKEIARRLGLSVKTVENHRANILGKLQARNAAEAVSRAVERGLVHSHTAAGLARSQPRF